MIKPLLLSLGFCLSIGFDGASYASNPASTDYVNQQIRFAMDNLQAQINAIP